MGKQHFICAMAVPAIGVWVVPLLVLGAATATHGQGTTEAGIQVLTRGPVHEAFATASMTGATAGVVISKTPYDPIDELPPDQRPDGANVAWIPGYWDWDDDRSDYIWVSGVWRDLPPGRQWVPGYWAPVGNGVQWISGFWGVTAQTEVTYLPPPPEPLEAGPSSPMPGPNHGWSPGCWVWQQRRFYWQPGYWVVQRPDWVWTPAHYSWTPRGHVYVPGYWDYDMLHRGVMFAPVYYEQPVYRRPGYYYSPSIVIDIGVIAAFLFVRPSSRHYYYGDYYDNRYQERGFSPWYSNQTTRYGGDPIYAHYRLQQLRQRPDWDTHVVEQYRYRREHVAARPPQTLALQINIINNQRADAPQRPVIGRRLADTAQDNTLPLRFTSMNMDERKRIETRGREVHKLQSERARMETPTKAERSSSRARESAQPVKLRLPASPVAARPVENMEGARTPPPVPVAPKPRVAESRGRQEQPRKAETESTPRQPQKKPEKTEGRSSPARETPRRVESKPDTKRVEPTPQRNAPNAAPARRDTLPAQPKAAPPAARQAPSRPTAVQPKHESARPEAAQPKVSSQKPQSKAQTRKKDAEKQKSSREQTPNKDENKKKKGRK